MKTQSFENKNIANVNGPFKKAPVERTGPTIPTDIRGNPVGRMPSRGERNILAQAANRMTQFAFQSPTARQVSLAGEFNNWDTKAGPMHKGPDGVWHLSVALKPGRYEYRFLADGVWCDNPAAEQKAANSLGTENCVRVV